MNVLAPDGRTFNVPESDVSALISGAGGFILDSGEDPQFQMPDGTIVQGTVEQAAQLAGSGGKLLSSKSLKMYDPEGTLRAVPLENISAASAAGFRTSRKQPVDSPLPSETQEPVGLAPKTWRTAFQEVGERPMSFLPFLNVVDAFESLDIYRLAKKQKRGEQLTPMESEKLNTWLKEQGRDSSWGYKVWSTALRMPAFMGEFVASTGAIKATAKKAVTRSLGRVVVTEADDIAKSPAVKALLEKAVDYGADMPAMKTFVETRLARAPGVAVPVDDIISSGLGQGTKAAAYTTVNSFGKTVPNYDALSKAVAKVYATVDVPGAGGGTKLAQWFLRDNLSELNENAALWGKAFWSKKMTAEAAAAGKTAANAAGRQMLRAAVEAAAPRAIMQAHRITDQTIQNRIQNVLSNEDDDFLPAFAKAYGDNVIENFSEQTGENLAFLSGMFDGVTQRMLMKSATLNSAVDWFAKKKFGGAKDLAAKYLLGDNGFLQRAGWNGVIGEMMEEGVGGVLRMGTGISEPGLPSFGDLTSMAVGFAINPLAGVSLIQGARTAEWRKVMDKMGEWSKEVRSTPGLAITKEQLDKGKEFFREAIESTKPGTIEGSAEEATPATATTRLGKAGDAIANALANFGSWLTLSKAANQSIIALADEVSKGRVSDSIRARRKISDRTLDRIVLGFLERRTITESQEDARDLNIIDQNIKSPGMASDLRTALDGEENSVTPIPAVDTTKISAERLAELAAKYPEHFSKGIIVADGTADVLSVTATGHELTDEDEVTPFLSGDRDNASPVLTESQRIALADAVGFRAPMDIAIASGAQVEDVVRHAVRNKIKLVGQQDAIFAEDAGEIGSKGYRHALSVKGVNVYTAKDLRETGLVVNDASLKDGHGYILARRPAATTGDEVHLNWSPGRFMLSSLVEDMTELWYNRTLKDKSLGKSFYESAKLGREQLRDIVAVHLAAAKPGSEQESALKALTPLVEAEDDASLRELFSQFTTAQLGYNASEWQQTSGGRAQRYTEISAHTGTKFHQLWREAGLVDVIPPAFASIYQLDSAKSFLPPMAMVKGRNSVANPVPFSIDTATGVDVMKNAGKKYGIDITIKDGVPEFSATDGLIAMGEKQAIANLAQIGKRLFPSTNIDKQKKAFRKDVAARIAANRKAAFEKELASVRVPGFEKQSDGTWKATEKKISQDEADKYAEYLSELSALGDTSSLPTAEDVQALVDEGVEAPPPPPPPPPAEEEESEKPAAALADSKEMVTEATGIEFAAGTNELDVAVLSDDAAKFLELPEKQPVNLDEIVDRAHSLLREYLETGVDPKLGVVVPSVDNLAFGIHMYYASKDTGLSFSMEPVLARNLIKMIELDAKQHGNSQSVTTQVVNKLKRAFLPPHEQEELEEEPRERMDDPNWHPADPSRSEMMRAFLAILRAGRDRGFTGSAEQIMRDEDHDKMLLSRFFDRTVRNISDKQVQQLAEASEVPYDVLRKADNPPLYNDATFSAWMKLAPEWENTPKTFDELTTPEIEDLRYRVGHVMPEGENLQKAIDQMIASRGAVARQLSKYRMLFRADQAQLTIQALINEHPEESLAVRIDAQGNVSSVTQNRRIDRKRVRGNITDFVNNNDMNWFSRALLLNFELGIPTAEIQVIDKNLSIRKGGWLPLDLVKAQYARYGLTDMSRPVVEQLLEKRDPRGMALLEDTIRSVTGNEAFIAEFMRMAAVKPPNIKSGGSALDRFLRDLRFNASMNRDRNTGQLSTWTSGENTVVNMQGLAGRQGIKGKEGSKYIQFAKKLRDDLDRLYQSAIETIPPHPSQLKSRGRTIAGTNRLFSRVGDYFSEVIREYAAQHPNVSMASIQSAEYNGADSDVTELTSDEIDGIMKQMWEQEGKIFVPILSGDHRFARGILIRVQTEELLAAEDRDAFYEKTFNEHYHALHKAAFSVDNPVTKDGKTLYDNVDAALKRASQMVSSGIPATLVEDGAGPTVYFVRMDNFIGKPDAADGAMHGMASDLEKLSRSFGYTKAGVSHAIKFIVSGANEVIKQHTTAITRERTRENPYYKMLADSIARIKQELKLPENAVVFVGSDGAFKTPNAKMLTIKQDGSFEVDGKTIDQVSMENLHPVKLGYLRYLSNQDKTGNAQKVKDLVNNALKVPGITEEQKASIVRVLESDSADRAYRRLLSILNVDPNKLLDSPSQYLMDRISSYADIPVEEANFMRQSAWEEIVSARQRVADASDYVKLYDALLKTVKNKRLLAALRDWKYRYEEIGAEQFIKNLRIKETLAYSPAVYLHKAQALSQQVPNLTSLPFAEELQETTRQAVDAATSVLHQRAFASYVSENIADALPENEEAKILRDAISAARNTFDNTNAVQDIIDAAEHYASVYGADLETEVLDAIGALSETSKDPVFRNAVARVADDPAAYERILRGRFANPFDLAGQLQRMAAGVQRSIRFMRPAVLTVAVPAHLYGKDLDYERAVDGFFRKESRWVTDHEITPSGTRYGIASGDFGPEGQIRYARIVEGITDVSAYILENRELFGDLINSDGSVRLHEIIQRGDEVFIPGSLLDTNRVPGTVGSHFLVRLGFRPSGTAGELALHPDIVARAGADFDVDKWHAFPYLSREPQPGNFNSFNNDFVRTLMKMYDTPEGFAYIKKSIDLDTYKKSVFTPEELDAAENKYKKMPADEFYSHTGWLKAVRDTRDPRKLLGAGVASLSGSKLRADRFSLGVEAWKIPESILGVMPGFDGYVSRVGDTTLLPSNEIAAEVLHNQNNQVLDNTKNPLVADTGLTQNNVSIITALMFAQYHESPEQARERYKMLLDFFRNTPEGKYIVDKASQRSAKTPFAVQLRYEWMFDKLNRPFDKVVSGQKTAVTKSWWKTTPLVGQELVFEGPVEMGFTPQANVRVTKVHPPLHQRLRNGETFADMARGEGVSEETFRKMYESGRDIKDDSVQVEFEYLATGYRPSKSAEKFMRKLGQDLFVMNDVMVRLRNDQIDFSDVLALEEYFEDNTITDPMYLANRTAWEAIRREVYAKVPGILSTTAKAGYPWRPDNVAAARAVAQMARNEMLSSQPDMLSQPAHRGRPHELQSALIKELYTTYGESDFAKNHLIIDYIEGSPQNSVRSYYAGETMLPGTVAAAHSDFMKLDERGKDIFTMLALETWVPSFRAPTLLDLIPPAAVVDRVTSWVNRVAPMLDASKGSVYAPEVVGIVNHGRISDSAYPTIAVANVDTGLTYLRDHVEFPEPSTKTQNRNLMTIGTRTTKDGKVYVDATARDNVDQWVWNKYKEVRGAKDFEILPRYIADFSSLVSAINNGTDGGGIIYAGWGAPEWVKEIAAHYRADLIEIPPDAGSKDALIAFLNSRQALYNRIGKPHQLVIVNQEYEAIPTAGSYRDLIAAVKQDPRSRFRIDGISRTVGRGNAEALFAAFDAAPEGNTIIHQLDGVPAFLEQDPDSGFAIYRKVPEWKPQPQSTYPWHSAAVVRDRVTEQPSTSVADINKTTQYRGLSVVEDKEARPHPQHGGVSGARLVGNEIRIVKSELAIQFREKQWTKPRVTGVTALPADAFATLNDWFTFVLEHEYQHTKFPKIKSSESGYAANEDAINRAAAEALGITERLYPGGSMPFTLYDTAELMMALRTRNQPMISDEARGAALKEERRLRRALTIDEFANITGISQGQREALIAAARKPDTSYSLTPAIVDPDGTVKLGFAASVSDKSEKLFAAKTWTLEKALQESRFPKPAIEFIKKYWPEGTTSLRDGVAQVLREVVPELKIAGVTKQLPDEFTEGYVTYRRTPKGAWESRTVTFFSEEDPPHVGNWEPASAKEVEQAYANTIRSQEDVQGFYGGLSVNRGQGTYSEYFIKLPFAVPGQHGEFKDPNLMGWFRTRAMPDGGLDVQEIQSELFQKNKGGFVSSLERTELGGVDKFDTQAGTWARTAAGWVLETNDGGETVRVPGTEAEALVDFRENRIGYEKPLASNVVGSPEQTAFLNLMLKDQTWVPVFVNAITQWARNQGFERVRFPTGETAARVEGHQVLADRLTALQTEKKEVEAGVHLPKDGFFSAEGAEIVRRGDSWQKNGVVISLTEAISEYENLGPSDSGDARSIKTIDAEIQQLKTQGVEKLAPIEAFYQSRVGKIVRAMGAKPFTDANGNTWNEISFSPDYAMDSDSKLAHSVAQDTITSGAAMYPVRAAILKRIAQARSRHMNPEQAASFVYNQALRGDVSSRVDETNFNKARFMSAYALIGGISPEAPGMEHYEAVNQERFAIGNDDVVRRAMSATSPADVQAAMDEIAQVSPNSAARISEAAEQLEFRFDYAATAIDWARYSVNQAMLPEYRLRDYKSEEEHYRNYAKVQQGVIAALYNYSAKIEELEMRLGLKLTKDGRLFAYDKDGKQKVISSMRHLKRAVWDRTFKAVDVATGERSEVTMTAENQTAVRNMLNGVGILLDAGGNQDTEVVVKQSSIMGKTIKLAQDTTGDEKPSQEAIRDAAEKILGELTVGGYDVANEVTYDDAGDITNVVAIVSATPRKLFDAYKKTNAYRKLLASRNGDDKLISPYQIYNELRGAFDELPEEVRKMTARLGFPITINKLKSYFPHVYSEYGVFTPAEMAVYEQTMDLIREAGKKKPLADVIRRAFSVLPEDVNVPQSQWPAANADQARYIRAMEMALGVSEAKYFDTKSASKVAANREMLRLIRSYAVRESASNIVAMENVASLLVMLETQERELLRSKSRYITESARLRPRYYTTFGEAYEEAGLLPGELNPLQALRNYITGVMNTTANKAVVSQVARSASPIDGSPNMIIIVDKNLEEAAEQFMPRSVYERMARNAASVLNTSYDDTKTPYENLRLLVPRLGAKKSRYKSIATPGYAFMESVYLLRGESAWEGFGENTYNAMRHILEQRWEAPWPKALQRFGVLVNNILGGSATMDDAAQRDMWDDIMLVTQMTKFSNLAFSLFFSFSAIESYVASQGFEGAIQGLMHPIQGWKEIAEFRKELIMGHGLGPHFKELLAAGYTHNLTHDKSVIDLGYPQRVIDALRSQEATMTKLGLRKKSGKILANVLEAQTGFSDWMFSDLFSTLKAVSATRLAEKVAHEKELRGLGPLTNQDYAIIANALNDGFGGQNWRSFWWATPKVMQLANLGVYAPNWTQSTFRTFGGSKLMEQLGLGPDIGQYGQDFVFKTYIPAMLAMVMFGWPNVLQAAIYAAAGDPDRDTPLTFGNEPNKRTHVDITPMMRLLPWYDGGDSKNRRMYVRWGKQAYEVIDPNKSWFADALKLNYKTLQSKLSAPVRMVFELVTGKQAGTGKELDFQNMGLLGLISGEKEGFAGSRVAHVAKTFLPFSLSSLFEKDGYKKLPLSLLGSVSMGAPMSTLKNDMQEVMMTYARAAKHAQYPPVMQAMKGISRDLVAAAIANGYRPEEMITKAKAGVLRELYSEFFKKLDAEKYDELDKVANSIISLGGSLKSLGQSFKKSGEKYFEERELTDEDVDAIVEAFTVKGLL